MLNILRLIHQEQANISKEQQEPNEKLDFFQDFFKKYPYGILKTYYEMDKCDLIIASLAADDNSIPFKELIEIININKPFFEQLTMDLYQTIAEAYIRLAEFELEDKTYALIRMGIRPSKEECEEDLNKKAIASLIDIADEHQIQYSDFINILRVFEYELTLNDEKTGFAHKELPLMQALAAHRLLNETKDKYQEFSEVLTDSRYKKHMTPSLKQQTKSTIQGLKNTVDEHMSTLKRYYEFLTSAHKAKKKQLLKDQTQYEKLEQEMYALTAEPNVIASDKTIEKIPNEAIRMAALRLIYSHNLKIYQETEQEYLTLAANDASNYRILLANYGLSPSDYEVGSIMNNPLRDVQQMLIELQQIEIKTPSILLSILQKSTLNTVKNYVSLVQKGIIASSSLVNHLELLDEDSKDYENIMRNLALLQSKKINPRYFSSNIETLLIDNQTFKSNLETLETYELMPSLKAGINSNFMNSPALKEAIDTLLELGYEKNLEERVELLNYQEKFNRLRLLKSLNMSVSTTEELISVLTTEKFFVPDSLIDAYILNAVPLCIPQPVSNTSSKKHLDLTKLTEFQTTPRTYTIGGVIISKNKVERNAATSKQFSKQGERLLYSILSGSVLTDQEIASISATLTNKQILVKK